MSELVRRTQKIDGASSTQSWKALHMQEYFERWKHAHPLSVNFGPSSDFGPRPADWKVACSSGRFRAKKVGGAKFETTCI